MLIRVKMDWNLFGIGVTAAAAIAGGYVSRQGLNSQAYKTQLQLSEYQPPGYVFGIAWTVIYVTYAYVWYKFVDSKYKHILFTINMLLNFLWVWLFFGQSTYTQSSLDWSKLVIIGLLGLTLYQAYLMWQTKKLVAVIPLLLYSLWLVLASKLNFDIKLIA